MQSRGATQHGEPSTGFEAWLLKLVDIGLLGVVFVAPLFMGGRGPAGKFVFVAFACLAAVAWLVRQAFSASAKWRWSGAELLLLGGLSILVLQLLPWSPGMLSTLSPASSELLPLWTADSSLGFGEWATASLDPYATRGGLVLYLAYGMLFVVLVQRLHRLSDVEWMLRALAWASIAMAVLGLVQFFLGNGKFLWVFEHPSRDTTHTVTGAFHNQNHFAHFLALGLGPLIWYIWRCEPKSVLKQVLTIGMLLVAVAGALTFSRGGVVAMAVAGLVCTLTYYRKSLIGRSSLLMGAGALGLVLVALSIYGYEPLARRLATLKDSRSLEEVSQGRSALWSALLDGIPEFAVLGSGVGSHRNVYPIYMEEYFEVEFTHGESGYLQLLLETGVPGLLLLIGGVALAVYWCLRTLSLRADSGSSRGSTSGQSDTRRKHALIACSGAVLSGIVASVVHSLGDFVWYVSACMSLTVILLACACRLYQLRMRTHDVEGAVEHASFSPSGQSESRVVIYADWLLQSFQRSVELPRVAWIAAAVAVTCGTAVMLNDRIGPAMAASDWNHYLRISLGHDGLADLDEAQERDLLDRMALHLERTLARDPNNSRANLRLTANCLRRFELLQRHATNPMPLSMIREAAIASQFPTKEALDKWMAVAIGEQRELLQQALDHCRLGLRRCPLQGEGYIYLVDLLFLEGYRGEAKQAFIAQAQRVRPHSGIVLFATGQEAILAGDLDTAKGYWKRAFDQDRQIRSLIIGAFAPRVPAGEFLETFQPDVGSLATLYSHYRNTGRIDDARLVGQQYVDSLQDLASTAVASNQPAVASARLYTAQAIYSYLGDSTRAIECAKKAVELDGANFDKHHTLAALLAQGGQYAEAIEHYRWCLQRRPNDQGIIQALSQANRQQLMR